MKVIEKAETPDGIKIQLEDWREHNTPDFPDCYGFEIGAYPIAQKTSKSGIIKGGELFRLTISQNKYLNYTNEMVKSDFQDLKSGVKKLADLKIHFWNREKDAYILGL